MSILSIKFHSSSGIRKEDKPGPKVEVSKIKKEKENAFFFNFCF